MGSYLLIVPIAGSIATPLPVGTFPSQADCVHAQNSFSAVGEPSRFTHTILTSWCVPSGLTKAKTK